MKNYSIYLTFPTTQNDVDIGVEAFNFLSFFENSLLKTKKIIQLNCNSSCMTESNKCISFSLKVKTENDISIDTLTQVIKELYIEEYNGLIFNNSKNTLYVGHDTIFNFKDASLPCILKEDNFNKDIKKINFLANVPSNSQTAATVNILLYDKDEQEISTHYEWKDVFKKQFSTFFNGSSLDSVTLGMISDLLTGSEPDSNFIHYFNENTLITTDFMEDFDFFEKDKTWKNCRITIDY